MSNQCKDHQDIINRVHIRIDSTSKDITDIKTLQASIQTDVVWIKDNIKNAMENKKWLIGTGIAIAALFIAIIK